MFKIIGNIIKTGKFNRFYSKYPDLVPRNMYLYSNRIITEAEIDKYINKIVRKSKLAKLLDLFKS